MYQSNLWLINSTRSVLGVSLNVFFFYKFNKKFTIPRNLSWHVPRRPSTRTPPRESDLFWPAASHPRAEPVRRTTRRLLCRCPRARLLWATGRRHCTVSTSASSGGRPPGSIRNHLRTTRDHHVTARAEIVSVRLDREPVKPRTRIYYYVLITKG